jgi:hypothetical protein
MSSAMNVIRVHHRSRKRILIANVLSMIVMGPFAYGIAFLGQFQGPSMWVAVILFASNMGLFGWNTWTVARQNRDFVCLLTNERLVCQSPDESLARSFDVPFVEIVKLAEADQTEGGPRFSLHTQDGDSVTLTYNFGNPARSIFEDLRRMLPSVPVEKS